MSFKHTRTLPKGVAWLELTLRLIGCLLACVLLIWGLEPLLALGIYNAGVIALLSAGTLLLLACLLFRPLCRLLTVLWRSRIMRVLLCTLFMLVVGLLVLFLVVSCQMLVAAARKPASNATLVVLGAALHEDRPSLMLAARLDSAVNYLNANPASACIVSGGQGEDEIVSEAAVMRQYLLDRGIAENRVYIEDASTSTSENVRYSRAIIEKNSLNPQVVIATQEFHQLRAQAFAAQEGLAVSGSCTSRSPGYLLPCYWVREFAAICRMWLLGY